MAEKNMNAKISVEFEETANRQQLSSGDNLPTLFGKIKKFFIDLKAVAFSGSYNDLSDKPTTATTDTDGLMSSSDKNKLDSADDTYALKSLYGDTTINVGRKAGSAVGEYSTTEGAGTIASGYASHAEGSNAYISNGEIAFYDTRTVTISDAVTVEVDSSQAYGINSHAEGLQTLAYGANSHAEGKQTTASGVGSHAEGYGSTASGDVSHAGGYYTKALKVAEFAHGQYNQSNADTLFSIGDGTADDARHNAFEITTTGGKLHDKDIATTDEIPDLSAYAKTADIPNIKVNEAVNADTVDNLHADDFVNANDRDHVQIPSNVDVPAWICANGKRYQLYMTNGDNIGLTNVPNDSRDWVWYWFDGINIIAREWVTGKYYICDTINGSFSGWKDIYTSGYKPYVTGVVVVDSNGKANVSFGFEPSFVLYEPTSPKSGIFGSVYSATICDATGFKPSADTYTGGLTGKGFSYIAFK